MTDFVVDTFTGSGTLATHAGEVGATWSAESWFSSADPADYVLDGAGALTTWHNTNDVHVLASGSSLSADYYVELEIDVIDPGQSSFVNLIARKTGTGSGTKFYEARLKLLGVNSEINLRRREGSDTDFGWTSYFNVTAGVHTLRLELTGANLRTYYDGILKHNVTDPSPLLSPGVAGMGFQGNTGGFGGTWTKGLAFRAGEILSSESFWSNRIRTQEII